MRALLSPHLFFLPAFRLNVVSIKEEENKSTNKNITNLEYKYSLNVVFSFKKKLK